MYIGLHSGSETCMVRMTRYITRLTRGALRFYSVPGQMMLARADAMAILTRSFVDEAHIRHTKLGRARA